MSKSKLLTLYESRMLSRSRQREREIVRLLFSPSVHGVCFEVNEMGADNKAAK